MIIKEQVYTILNSEYTSSINWNETYQTLETARFSIDKLKFVISKSLDSDYLSHLNWINSEEIYKIVNTDEFSGERINTHNSGSSE